MDLQDPLLAALVAITGGFYVAIAAVLLRRYLRGRDVGVVWLGIAVVVWPLLSLLIGFGQSWFTDRLRRGETLVFPFSLVARGRLSMGGLAMSLDLSRQIVGVALLLVAVLYLGKAGAPRRLETSN